MMKGFTLLELLVVIAIIGILSSVVLASFGGVRGKARDAQRMSGMKAYQTAFELVKLNGVSLPLGVRYLVPGGPGSSDIDELLVENGFISALSYDPINNVNDGTRTSGYVYGNGATSGSGSINAWFVGDNDSNTYAVRFLVEDNIVSPDRGFRCLTSNGIHKAGDLPGENSNKTQCLQQ